MRVASKVQEIRQKVIELDQRYRSTWDVRSIAHVLKTGHSTVAKILREERGPRPEPPKKRHDIRTRFLYPDVMWSSDYQDLPNGCLETNLDECSVFHVGWHMAKSPTARDAVKHAEDTVKRMGRVPLIWKYDHGSCYTSDLFQDFLACNHILPYPIPPRSPWAQGRVERDHQEIQHWFIPLLGKNLTPEDWDKEIDEGFFMLNFIKPRAVLDYRTSADVFFNTIRIVDDIREHFAMHVEDLKTQFGLYGNERLHRKAIRVALQQWGLYNEWVSKPKGSNLSTNIDS